MADKLSRRELFSIFRRSVDSAIRPKGPPPPLRPPGATTELKLADTCMRCGRCEAMCPRQAIRPLSAEYGDAHGTPHIVARDAPCVLCEGLLCSTVCPSGALTPVRRATEVQMGIAVIDATRCLPYRGDKCSVCLDRCPIQGALRLDEKGRPQVHDTCTGCGICEYYCPTEPTAIKVRPWSVRK